MQVISASQKEDIDSILSEYNGVAILLLYKQQIKFDNKLLSQVIHLSQEMGVPLIKIDVQKTPQFAKSTNIHEKPSLALISGSSDNIIDYRSEASQADAKELYQMAKQLKIKGIKDPQAILGKEYHYAKID